MTAVSATTTDEDQHPRLSPLKRNWVWWGFQFIAKFAFTVWFRARTRGMENLPKEGGALLLMNHRSFLDPLVTGVWLTRPVSFLARDSLFRVPVVGWILRHTYVIPINRSAASTASIRETAKRLEQGFLVGIFPEGTRSTDGKLGKLRPGFLAITRRVKAPVIPVGIDGTGKAYGKGAWFPKPYRVRVVIGEPLDSETVERLSQRGHEEEMMALISEKIEACCRAAHEWPRIETTGATTAKG